MAFRKDGSYVKVARYHQIERKIASQFPNPVSVDLLILWVKLNVGLGEAKAREYIEDVVKGKDWVIVDGSIMAELPEVKP